MDAGTKNHPAWREPSSCRDQLKFSTLPQKFLLEEWPYTSCRAILQNDRSAYQHEKYLFFHLPSGKLSCLQKLSGHNEEQGMRGSLKDWRREEFAAVASLAVCNHKRACGPKHIFRIQD